MKKLILFLFLSSLTISCSDDDTKEDNVLVGKWKLSKIGYFDSNEYMPKNDEYVHYTFTNTNNLIIESNVNLPVEDLSFQFTSPTTIPYSFHQDNEFLMEKVVRLGNQSNGYQLGTYGFCKEENTLRLYEYDGKVIRFEKIQ
ncbi:hypothetical protein MG290_10335 [Flavobacterium sp. CBA20B-1]|uniref:hypothetical protein n=1 Tax=unclassified Flavobacterium TaxID=196869 RepID=UPI0022251AA6|nr:MULTISPECIES: hypothetical protein [unclassified Flavobacterium]WCM41353.1 hypothetical protein MG290_10335 [Flavobacterium sp. CBA20B-1]